jgi:hypothetical protein
MVASCPTIEQQHRISKTPALELTESQPQGRCGGRKISDERRPAPRFIATRGMLIAILGRYLNAQPERVRFCYYAQANHTFKHGLGKTMEFFQRISIPRHGGFCLSARTTMWHWFCVNLLHI